MNLNKKEPFKLTEIGIVLHHAVDKPMDWDEILEQAKRHEKWSLVDFSKKYTEDDINDKMVTNIIIPFR